MTRFSVIWAIAGIFLAFKSPTSAFACRCLSVDADPSPEKKVSLFAYIADRSRFVVTGEIRVIEKQKLPSIVSPSDDKVFGADVNASIIVDHVLHGDPYAAIELSGAAARSFYNGSLDSNIAGTCAPRWRDGDYGIWVVLENSEGQYGLASSCVHNLLRDILSGNKVDSDQ